MDYLAYSRQLTNNPTEDICLALIHDAISDNALTFGQKHFIYNQLLRKSFLNQIPNTKSVENALDDMYLEIFDEIYRELGVELKPIPYAERNKNFVVVLTSQVLSEGHGPTKTLFDRCHALRKMGKELLIINTADMMPKIHAIPWENPVFGSYIPEFSDLVYLESKGEFYNYFQCPDIMPDINLISELLNTVIKLKPEMIISIGGNNIFSDICSKIITTLTVSTVFSGRSTTLGTFQNISRPINEGDLLWAKKHGKTSFHFIEGRFTFTLREQEHKYKRADFGIPENCFVGIVSGTRLDYEIDNDFINLLTKLMDKGIHFVFIGVFDDYQKYLNDYPIFKTKSTYLGVQKDVLAINELCDIYVNPRRVGGGTTCVEALSKGVPVVTDAYGDVFNAAGPDFGVNGFDEMYERIIRLMNDADYRSKMKSLAIERSSILLDSDEEFSRIYNVAISRLLENKLNE